MGEYGIKYFIEDMLYVRCLFNIEVKMLGRLMVEEWFFKGEVGMEI